MIYLLEYLMKTELLITGMTCPNCVKHVQAALQSVPDVSNVTVDLASGIAVVTHGEATTPALLVAAVEEEEYEAQIMP